MSTISVKVPVKSESTRLGLYDSISRIKRLRRFSHKFFFIAFLGIHIPLLGALAYVFNIENVQWQDVLISVLAFTLFATVLTIYVLNDLLRPVNLICDELERSAETMERTELPVHYRDEIGQLMRLINSTTREQVEMIKEKDDLINLMGHDIRTPAAQIVGLCELVKSSRDEREKAELINDIHNSAQNQLGFLEEVLDWLKAERNSSATPVPMQRMVQSTIDKLRIKADKKEVDLKADIGEMASGMFVPSPVKNILENLITNAIKFSDRGSDVSINARREGDVCSIEVKDNGCGFNPDHSEQLFERFTDSSRPGTEGEASSGLGLYLSRKLARKFRGDVYAESEGPGKGSKFTVRIPIA